MRKRSYGLILLGLLAYLIFLLATLPAARAWAWFGDRLPLTLYGLDGTVWSGQAAVAQDKIRRVEALQWQLHPSALLRGQLAVDARGRLPADGRLRGEFRLSRGQLQAQDLKFDLPATQLLQWATIKLPVVVAGRIDSLLPELVVRDGALARVDGIVNWQQASVNLGRQPLPLGNLALRLTPAGDAINGVLVNQGSPLELNGELRLSPDGKFVLDLKARLADKADDAARKTFGAVGVPADGSAIQARLSGALDGTGVRLEALNR